MKELLMAAQKRCADALSSFRSAFTLSDGEPLEWTDGVCAIYELIQGLVTKGSFNNGRAKQEDVINFFNASLNMNLTPEGSYENGRTDEKKKKDAKAWRSMMSEEISKAAHIGLTICVPVSTTSGFARTRPGTVVE